MSYDFYNKRMVDRMFRARGDHKEEMARIKINEKEVEHEIELEDKEFERESKRKELKDNQEMLLKTAEYFSKEEKKEIAILSLPEDLRTELKEALETVVTTVK